MNRLPATPPFLGTRSDAPIACAPAILGVPYDKTASFRKGTREGPNAIRDVSDAGIETYSPTQNKDLEELTFSDLGNLTIEPEAAPETVVAALHAAVGELFAAKAIPIVLGGEHSISPGAIHAAFERHPDLAVIQFDAHADLRESYEGTPHSHACAMRRVLDFLPADRLLQVGIRSGTAGEFREMRDAERLIEAEFQAVDTAIQSRGWERVPIWITFDFDVFDPSELPGTGTPEAGGMTWREFEEIRPLFDALNIVGIDLVELSPQLDPSGISAVLAAKLLREWLLLMAN